jgi:tRNA A37 methylthiotransferase MiaB
MEGTVVEVLVEGRGRKGGAQGRTRTNKVVNFAGEAEPGTFVDVRIERAHPHHLTGDRVFAAVPA